MIENALYLVFWLALSYFTVRNALTAYRSKRIRSSVTENLFGHERIDLDTTPRLYRFLTGLLIVMAALSATMAFIVLYYIIFRSN